MKSPSRSIFRAARFSGLALGLVYLLSTQCVLAQTPFTWTNLSQNGAWEMPLNWLPTLSPNSEQADVQIDNASPCTLNSDATVHTLSLGNGTLLNLAAGSTLRFPASVPGSIANNGTIRVNTTGQNDFTQLLFFADMQLNGNGRIILAGGNPGNNLGDGEILIVGGTTTHATTHTISGRGDLRIQDGLLVNQGTIAATEAGRDLEIILDGDALQNSGTIEALNGGVLSFSTHGTINNSPPGLIFAEGTGSVVELGRYSGPVFNNTQFNTNGGGLILTVSGTFNGCTNNGQMRMFNTSGTGFPLVISGGGLTNNGTLTLTAGFANSPTYLHAQANVQLDGTGDLKLDRSEIRLHGFTLTHAASHRIHGTGYLALDFGISLGALVNNGSITADDASGQLRIGRGKSKQNNGALAATQGGLLLIEGPLDQNGGGTISASGPNSRVLLDGSGFPGPEFAGGILRTDGGGVITADNVVLKSCVNLGNLQIASGNISWIAGNGITNDGTITIANESTILSFLNGGTIAGAGSFVLKGVDGGFTSVFFPGNATTTNSSAHTLSGQGNVRTGSNGVFLNQGIISPGAPIGRVRFSGNLELGAQSQLTFEIGGTTAATEYDAIDKMDRDFFGNPVPGSPLTLNGTLSVTLANGFIPAPSHTFNIITTANPLSGAFLNVANGGRLTVADGQGSFRVSYNGTNVVLTDFQPASSGSPTPSPSPSPSPSPTATVAPGSAQPLNISTRMRVLTGNNVMIGGFIITGNENKKVLVRALGPSLNEAGVPDILANPVLELRASDGNLLLLNDNWKDTQAAEITDTQIAPQNDFESAIVMTLSPGQYTAVVRGKDDGIGVGLVEVYDLTGGAGAKLANISTRGFVQTGDNVLIGGFILGGGQSSNQIVVRGIGPSLTGAGIVNALQDPLLELRNSNGVLLQSNDNWKDTQQSQIETTGLSPSNNSESAMVAMIPSGNYTAILAGTNQGTGVGLVEVYSLP